MPWVDLSHPNIADRSVSVCVCLSEVSGRGAGLQELRAAFPDDAINDDTDQYITRVVAGKLLTGPLAKGSAGGREKRGYLRFVYEFVEALRRIL